LRIKEQETRLILPEHDDDDDDDEEEEEKTLTIRGPAEFRNLLNSVDPF
jgi:hypothetical protein